MSQIPSTEEILHRMGVHVSLHGAGSQSPPIDMETSANDSASLDPVSSDGGPHDFPLESPDFSPLQFEIETALEGTRQVGQLNPRKGGLYNDAIQFLKKVMRRSLSWYTRPIHYFQGGVIRALQQTLVLLQGHEDSLQMISRELARQSGVIQRGSQKSSKQRGLTAGEIAALECRTVTLEQRLSQARDEFEEKLFLMRAEFDAKRSQTHAELDAKQAGARAVQDEKLAQATGSFGQCFAHLTDTLHALGDEFKRISNEVREVHALGDEVKRIRNEVHEVKIGGRVRDRDLRRFFHDVQVGEIGPSKPAELPPVPAMFPSGLTSNSQFDYFLFEELYRGDEATIAIRQKEYLELFRAQSNVLDVGCGRGEFLELLRDSGISAKGVEFGTDQYLLCREKGLDVVQQDLFEYLEALPDESLGGLFSAQVIEHLSASDQLRFVSLAYFKTRIGSPVVFETINTQCVFAVMRNFFLDPTHVRPMHPETLKFAMESAKFHDVELRFSAPMSELQIPPLKIDGDTTQLAEFNRAIEHLNELIYGFMDYAAIGWR